jgi:internalin A
MTAKAQAAYKEALSRIEVCRREGTEGRVLDLSHLGLTNLPPEIGQLFALTRLDLHSNQLKSLPPEIGRLKRLKLLILERNALDDLPESLTELRGLRELTLHGNETLGLPVEVLGPIYADSRSGTNPPANPQSILNYYFRIKGVGTSAPLNEFKLILVGRGGVGKTALVNRIIRDDFSATDITRGIHIEPWEVQVGADRVAAHVWDFGGQDIMHGTHQFFLTERSLYVLVLAARENKQNEDAEYWLKTISAFGGNSRVIVVLNKSDERPCEVNENALRKKYPAICEFIETDCKTGRGIKELRKSITTVADGLDGLRAAFPAAWTAIKKKLSGMKDNFLSFEEFRRECAALGESKENEQEILAGVLHVLGIALNYRDDERLRETSVLNPLWVTGGIYSLLNDNTLARRHGEMRLTDFKRILTPKDYPVSTHEFLKNLMGKFELCFPLEGKESCYLIPELLGEQEPDEVGPLDTNEALAFTYFYPKMLPHGLIPRLIVRLYQIIRGELRWRTGAVSNGSKLWLL